MENSRNGKFQSQISWIFGAYEAQLAWIFANLFDIHEYPGYLGPMKHKSLGYLGHIKRDTPGYSRNSWIFRACIIKCSQFTKGKLFFGLTTPKIHTPLCAALEINTKIKGAKISGILFTEFSLLELLWNPGKFFQGIFFSWN